MMKSKNISLNSIEQSIREMEGRDIEAIISCVNSDVPILVLNAVIFGAAYKVKDKRFIDKLNNDLINSNITFFGNRLSDYVIAALSVLGIENYTGNNTFVKSLIRTNMSIQ